MQDPTAATGKGKEQARLALILICASISLLLYLVLTQVAVKLSSAEPSRAGEVFPWVRLILHDALDAMHGQQTGIRYGAAFFACYAGLFGLYGIMLHAARGRQPVWFQTIVFVSGAVFLASLLVAPVMLSSDAYAYAYYGRLLSVYGVDAHASVPPNSLSDPFLTDGHYEFVPSVYGPLWTLISAGLAHVGGIHVGWTLLLFRGLEALAVLGGAALIWLTLRRIAPDCATQGVLLFLWNPLVIIESAMSGHNDSVMMFLALLAMYLHVRGHKAGAVVALTLSALVKLITAPLIPLYMLMVVRSATGWKERLTFLARAGLSAAVVTLATGHFAKLNPKPTLVRTATSPAFYENNYHELIFTGLRRLFGEDADSVEVSMNFGSWWVQTMMPTVLHAMPSKKSAILCLLQPDQPLLVIAEQNWDDWVMVYDPAHRLKGFANYGTVTVIPDPEHAEDDPVVEQLSLPPLEWPTVLKANTYIRRVTWILFAAFGLVAAWKAKDFDQFLTWAPAVLIAAQLLVLTQIWQWYLIWPLAFGALKPAGLPARFAFILSAGIMSLYVWFECTDFAEWLYTVRSIPAMVLPVALFAVLNARRLFSSRADPKAIPGVDGAEFV